MDAFWGRFLHFGWLHFFSFEGFATIMTPTLVSKLYLLLEPYLAVPFECEG